MKTNVLVVDDNDRIIEMVQDYFMNNEKIDVPYSAHNGEEALDIILSPKNRVDVVLLDIVMPIKDGMYVLEVLKEKNININVIIVTSFNEDDTIREASEYGVKYFVLKPFDFKRLENKILSFKRKEEGDILYLSNKELFKEVTRILHELGIPSHIKGYQYIRDGIIMMYENPNLIGGITKELYPEIAKKYKTTISRVERAIRHAIELSWNRGNWDFMEEVFGHSVDIDKAKPTNSEFIATISDKLRMDDFSKKK